MKKIVWLVAGWCLAFLAGASELPDSVVMTVAGEPVGVEEFVFMAQKNGQVDFSDDKSLREFVNLYRNFKLKVHEAEELGMGGGHNFREELDRYKAQLRHSLLSDPEAEEAYAKTIYDRGDTLLDVSQIVFRLPARYVSVDTLDASREAWAAYERIRSGEDFEALGKALADTAGGRIVVNHARGLMPMRTLKAFEEVAYALPEGGVSAPTRTSVGFHIIKVNARRPNPGLARVAHVLVACPADSSGTYREAMRAKADSLYQALKGGADFAEVAKRYSDDPQSARVGGDLPAFGPGEMVAPFEEASFALREPGDLSGVVETSYGFHIIQLKSHLPRKGFEQEKTGLIRTMAQGERNFELYQAHDDTLKAVYGYEFYPEAYAELQALCDSVFPTDDAFYERAKAMERPLARIDGEAHPQKEFAYYLRVAPFSTKAYSGDFMREVYDLFVRDILTTIEKANFEKRHPEYDFLINEYREGMLLFNISERTLWNKPAAEQAEAERRWVDELAGKYPVEINWTLLEKLKK